MHRQDGPDPSPIARIQAALSHNLIIQLMVTAMVALTGLAVLPWELVGAWTLVALVAFGAEDRLLLIASRDDAFARVAGMIAPWLRALATTVYAVACFALITYGGPGQRLFAFALMACSMVYVLMRYYRAPWIFLASISPYAAILGHVVWNLARRQLEQDNLLGAVGSVFPLILFAILLWSGRRQLWGSWKELVQAREAAEERERAAAQANLAKSHFLAAMSHELRTPLNGVLGMAQALTSDRLTETQRERVKIIRRSSETLLSVLNDLLDLSKIETSMLELEVVEFDLEHLVRGVAAAFASGAQKKGVGFDFEVSPEAGGHWLGDSARLRRVLYNLADNAVKFTDTGAIRLLARCEGGELVFDLHDTGVGIAEEHLPSLFEDFFQADTSLTRKTGGAGLGLAICRELVQLMGGRIAASSELGAGSTFTVRLPLARAAAPAAQPAPATQAEERPAELRVLVAEDNPTNQLVLTTLLSQAGIAPVVVENGRLALEAWEREPWDIVLMDIQMPEMDGVAAARAIRRREAEVGRARTPIIAVTANAMAHQLAEYDAAGMDGVVPKPINIADLLARMEQALDKAAEAAVAA